MEYDMEYVYDKYIETCEIFKRSIESTNPNRKLMEMHFEATINLIDAFRTYDDTKYSLIRKMAKNPFIIAYILLCNDTGVRLNENIILLEEAIYENIDDIDTIFVELKLFLLPKFLESKGQIALSFMNTFCEVAVYMSIGSIGLINYFNGETIDTNEDLILLFIPYLGNNLKYILGEEILDRLPNVSVAKDDLDLDWTDFEAVTKCVSNELDDSTCYALLANLLPNDSIGDFFASTLLTVQYFYQKEAPDFSTFFNKFYEIIDQRNRDRGNLAFHHYIDEDFKGEIEYICMYIWFYAEESMLGIIYNMLVMLQAGVYDPFYFKESFSNLIIISSTTIRELNK